MSDETQIEGIEDVRVVVWNFNTVLNLAERADELGKTPWQHALEAELYIDAAQFSKSVLERSPNALARGEEDLIDRIEDWITDTGFEGDADDILEIWFGAVVSVDPDLERLIGAINEAGGTQALILRADPRLGRHILVDQGVADYVDLSLASGELEALPHDATFLEAAETGLGVAPEQLLLVDVPGRLSDAADARGWKTYDFRLGEPMSLARALMPLLLRGADEQG